MARAFAITAALIGLIAGSLFLRGRGLDYLAPRTFLDGTVIIHQTQELRDKPADERGGALWQYYPLLYAHCVALLPDPSLEAEVERVGMRPLDADQHVQFASAQWVQARRVANWLSLALIPAAFLLARRFLGTGTALLSATIVAGSLLHMRFGTMVRPHGLASSLMVTCLLACLWARRRGSPLAILCAVTLAGLAIGSLHYGVFVLPPILMAVWLRDEGSAKRVYGALVVAGLILALLIRVLYPFHFLEDARNFMSLQETNEGGVGLNLSGQPLKLSRFNGTGFGRILVYLWSYEPLLLVLVPLGLLMLARRRLKGSRLTRSQAREAWVLAAFVLPYGVVIGLYAETWERFLIVLLPFFAGAAALVIQALYRRQRALGAVLGALLLGLSFASQWQLGNLRSAPDSAHVLGAWLEEHVAPKTERVQLLSYDDLPVLYTRESLIENRPQRWGSWWARYQSKVGPAQRAGDEWCVLLPPGQPAQIVQAYNTRPLEFLAENDAHWAIVKHEPDWRLDLSGTGLREARRRLQSRAEPVFRTSPVRAGGPALLEYASAKDTTWLRPYWLGLWRSERLGPTFEVYDLRP